jgi:hypothetical protein
VLPDRDGRDALDLLASYAFVERSGAGVSLHPLVAHAVAERVRHDGMRVTNLMLRIASHLRDRASRGDARSLHQLATLSEDPKLRAGMSPAHSSTLYGDDIRAGEADLVGLLFRGIAAEHGISFPEPRTQGELVLAALDDFHDDGVLAALPPAPLGHGQQHAADRVRTWVRRLIMSGLHDQPDLAALLEQRYLEPAATHDQVMRATFLSRATYFRRLRTARDLVAAAADRMGSPL